MKRQFKLGGLAVVLGVLAVVNPAVAQVEAGGFAINKFEPSEVGNDWFAQDSLDLRGNNRITVGAIGDYFYRALASYRDDGSVAASVVGHDFLLHVGAAWVLFDRVRLALQLPLQLYVDGQDSVVGSSVFRAPPNNAGVGDLRLAGDVRVFGQYRDPLTVAVGGQLWAPTGAQAQYLSDGGVRALARVSAAGALGAFEYAARLGSAYRYGSQELDAAAVGSEAVYGAAAGLRMLDGKLLVGPEFYGSSAFADFGKKRSSPFEVVVGAHYEPAKQWRVGAGVGGSLNRGLGTPVARVLASVEYVPLGAPGTNPDSDGDGIADAVDACPAVKGLPSPRSDLHGCPKAVDSDGDGVTDKEDRCPSISGTLNGTSSKDGCPLDSDKDGIPDNEDKCLNVPAGSNADPKKTGCPAPGDADGDGVLDPDDGCKTVKGVRSSDSKLNGCPPPDADGDGVLDAEDKCPAKAGVPSEKPEKHGCPPEAILEGGEIKVLDQVRFETASAKIVEDDETKRVLNAVLTILKEHPEITRLRVEGHTDSQGAAPLNRFLSQNRAQAVVKWLTTQGIAASRLVAAGLGPDRPIAPNDTDDGRKKNRRVEFHVETK